MIEMISPIPESVAQQDSLLVSHPESIPVCGCDVNGTYVSRASDIICIPTEDRMDDWESRSTRRAAYL